MNIMKRWAKRLRAVIRKEAIDRELDREMAHHLELEIQKNLRAGMTPEEARRQAYISFGGVERYKQQTRDARMLGWVSGLSLDFKLGARMLLRYPGLALVGSVALAVAIAIGATTFTVTHDLIDPAGLPVAQPGRVVYIQNVDTRTNNPTHRTHLQDLDVWRADLTTVGELGAYRFGSRNLVGRDGRIESVLVADIQAQALAIARTAPVMGRLFTAADERADAPPVVLIGYELWRSRFAADAEIIGKTLSLGGSSTTIVGVMPKGFGFPLDNHVWTPLRVRALDFPAGRAPSVFLVGRLSAGASLEQAQAQARGIAARLARSDPSTHEFIRTQVGPYSRLPILDSPTNIWTMYLVQLLVTVVLVAIGINVGILVYARTATRAAEIAVRTALGASRKRVVFQLCTEALVLSGIAALIGLAGAQYLLGRVEYALRYLGGGQVPYWWHFEISTGSVLYAAALAVLAAGIVGVVPALKATGAKVHGVLKRGGGGTTSLGRTWTLLIVAQTAVAVAVLPTPIGTLLDAVRDAAKKTESSADVFLTATLYMDESTLGPEGITPNPINPRAIDGEFRERFFTRREELFRRLEAEPGVVSVVPTTGPLPSLRIVALEIPTLAAGSGAAGSGGSVAPTSRTGRLARVDPGFFRAQGIPVRAGRDLAETDIAMNPSAIVVNEAFVESVLGGGEAVGRTFRVHGPNETSEELEIVGVMANADVFGRALIYRSVDLRHSNENPFSLSIRVRGKNPSEMTARIRAIALSVDPSLSFRQLMTLDDWIEWEGARDRLLENVLVAICAIGVLLSIAGISALMSFTVAQRRREIGIRVALGASRGHVVLTVMSRTLKQLGFGAAAGFAIVAMIATDYPKLDGLILFGGTAFTMIVVGVIAAFGPTREGLKVDPTEALKGQ